MFLEKEKVRSVMLKDYLKALGIFTESKKCETKNKIVDHKTKNYSEPQKLDLSKKE